VISGLAEEGHQILSAHLHEGFGEMDVSGKFQEVCARDYRWMRQCDVFVAVLPLDANGNVVVSNGTSVELGWASAIGKPIVIVCDPAPKYSHLVIGLDAIARVVKVDIGRPDLAVAVCDAIDIASSGDGLRLLPLGSAR
jgi:nucleoside 2-deoxyribosyltransferase